MLSTHHLIAATVLTLAMTACSAPDDEIADTPPSLSASTTEATFDIEVQSFLDAKYQSPDL